MFSVLFAILFQSLHSYEHFSGEELAVHQLDSKKLDVHQNDHSHQHCFVCEFTFSSFISSDGYSVPTFTKISVVPYEFAICTKPIVFSGSSSTLRGPPVSIC